MDGSKLKTWLKALRAPFFIAVILPALLGGVIAWSHGHFDLPVLIIVLVGLVMANAGTNLANDYFDYAQGKGSDAINKKRTPFSGGSPTLPEGVIKPEKIRRGVILCFGIAAIIGIYLSLISGWFVLSLVLIGGFIGYFYTAPPFRLGYRGVGELFTGIAIGPLIVVGTYYVLTKSVAIEPLIASLPMGILVSTILYINEFPDYEADKATGKTHLIVRLGRERALKFVPLLFMMAYTTIIAGILAGILPWTLIIALLTIPIALKIIGIVNRFYNSVQDYVPAMALTILTYSGTGVLLCVGYVLNGVL